MSIPCSGRTGLPSVITAQHQVDVRVWPQDQLSADLGRKGGWEGLFFTFLLPVLPRTLPPLAQGVQEAAQTTNTKSRLRRDAISTPSMRVPRTASLERPAVT